MLRLVFTGTTTIPIEADCITPDKLAGKTPREIAELPIQHGNRQIPLGEFFQIHGEAHDRRIVLEGDCSRVKWVGAGMTDGSLMIDGNIGMHVGAQMRGGLIEVRGNADDWAGAEMRDGTLKIRGNAGDLPGAAYRGARFGMRGGVILVEGKAGGEIGAGMRRGLIAVRGDAGDFAGASMIAGSIFLFGRPGARLGAGMKRGTIAVLGGQPELLPSFRLECVYRPVFLQLFWRYLREAGFAVAEEIVRAAYRRFSGDMVGLGKGEILVRE